MPIKKDINGNISGVRKSALERLKKLYNIKSTGYIEREILDVVCEISSEYNREIGVVVNRRGYIDDISMGTFSRAALPDSNIRGEQCRNLRQLHTHPLGTADLSDMDIAALKGTWLDAVCAVSVSRGGRAEAACIGCMDGESPLIFTVEDICAPEVLSRVLSYKRAEQSQTLNGADDIAVLVGFGREKDLDELAELARTSGVKVAGRLTQSRSKPETATFIGSGKLTELKELCQMKNAGLVIFDNELSGIQIRNLEAALNADVVDRSMVILDIFAGRATSVEGKLQVELAQLKYNLPRLIGISGKMDKMRAGIGMRGPGEKKLETDRRLIHREIFELENRIEKLKAERDLRRERRNDSNSFNAALVGYTNAGKSTVMNALSRSSVLAEDMLFATLDPVTRKVHAYGNEYFLLTDTVGFIDRLPHEFIDAFSSTLEEARQADLLLHIVDVSNPDHEAQCKVVTEVLKKLGIENRRCFTVYNKCDKSPDAALDNPAPICPGAFLVSARTGEGMAGLKDAIITAMRDRQA